MKPSIGRIVHFRLPDKYDGAEPRWRPAVITNVIEHELEVMPPITRHYTNLVVTLDGPNDADIDGDEGSAVDAPVHTVWRGTVSEGTEAGCWRWPPRV